MIIKSLSRKTPSFASLYDYIHRKADDAAVLAWNLPVADDREAVVSAFMENARELPRRKNGNVLYHEIISVPRKEHLSLEQQKDALHEAVLYYLQERAGYLLGYGKLHVEQLHLHVHLMLSSNEIGSSRRFRLSKARFAAIQKEVERYLLQQYPELEEKPVYSCAHETLPCSEKEYQYAKRTGQLTQKMRIKEKLQRIFSARLTEEEYQTVLASEGFTLYPRGQNVVVTDGKSKYRLKSLGLEEEYRTMVARCAEITVNQEGLARRIAEQKRRIRERDFADDFSPLLSSYDLVPPAR